MNTKAIGDVTEAMVLAALVKAGYAVLKPFGDNQRYDLVVEKEDGIFVRIQCKTGTLSAGAIRFRTCSSYRHRGRGSKGYRGQADLFGVYCSQTGKCYLVPVESAGERHCTLRIAATRNNQAAGVKWAHDYIIDGE